MQSTAVSTASTGPPLGSRAKRVAGGPVDRSPQRQRGGEDSVDTGDDDHEGGASHSAVQQGSGKKRRKAQSQQPKPRRAAAAVLASFASSTSSSSSVSAMARYFAELDRTPLTALVEVVPVDEVDETSGCAQS